jgi:hypothetical protein
MNTAAILRIFAVWLGFWLEIFSQKTLNDSFPILLFPFEANSLLFAFTQAYTFWFFQ